MREILFRGKRKYSDEWVEGDFYKVDCFCFIIPRNSNGTYSRGKNTLKNVYPCNECIPGTIGQYTGLTDKNGTKIFEGDIVKYPIGTFVVKFLSGTFCCSLIEDDYLTDICSIHNACEVIGNIHDNPELLKGGTDNGHP